MKVKFYKYILPVLCILTYSCTEDLATDAGSESLNGAGFSIPVSIDVPEVRTRAIDMTPGAALFLKNIWVGIYNANTGDEIHNEAIDLNHQYIASESVIKDLVKLNSLTVGTNTRCCIVAVANYDDVKTINEENGEKQALIDELKAANTWSKFTNIAIDTRASEFGSQTPMLMGYLSKTNASFKDAGYIKVDQFETADNKIHIYSDRPLLETSQLPDNNVFISSSSNSFNTNGYLLKLRRLRSKINVNVTTGNDKLTISDLQYKVFNRPKSAFLAPRRTNDFQQGNGNADYTKSPNSGDVLKNEFEDEKGYVDDEDFSRSVLNSSFSFEHFENKHWAMTDIANGLTKQNGESDAEFAARCYHEREVNEKSGEAVVFKALADKADDWNNNASYFVLKMNLRDENTGRNAEVYYTIHEGFINDKFGGEATSLSDRLHDFSCIRNTDYYYNITVNGVNDIHVQVTTSDESHTTDQAGSIWQINYSSSTRDENILKEKWPAYSQADNYQAHGENYVAYKDWVTIPSMHDIWNEESDFSNSEDVAFRLVGSVYDPVLAKESPVDVCYNFARGELDGFAGLWPTPTNATTEYIVSTNSNNIKTSAYKYFESFLANNDNVNSVNFRKLCEQVKVMYGNEEITISEYIKRIQGDESNPNPDPNIKGYRFEGLRYYEAFNPQKDDKRNHVRGLYIFDRKKAIKAKEAGETDRVKTDGDKCSYLYEINGAEQVPYYLDNEYYKMQKNEALQPQGSNSPIQSFKWYNPDVVAPGNPLTDPAEEFLLSAYPDLAFRVIGFDENNIDNVNATKYYDIWYNVKADEYFEKGHRNVVWPEINRNGIFSTEIAKGKLDEEKSVSSQFLQGIQVVLNGSNVYSLVDFVNRYEQHAIELKEGDRLSFQVDDYPVKVRGKQTAAAQAEYNQKYMRALYLFDRKNKFLPPLTFDAASNTATFKVYGVEQYPHLLPQIKLPTPTDVTYKNLTGKTSYVNILDPSIGTITIPALGNNGPASAYKYQIISKRTSGGNTVADGSLVIDNISPDANGTYTFEIPMKAIAGNPTATTATTTSNAIGSLTVQAVSENGDVVYSEVYSNSDPSSVVGTYTLTPPPTWSTNTQGINANNDFYSAWSDGASMRKNSEEDEKYRYLRFTGGDFATNGSCIRLSQNASTISFTVYKPCQITVSQTGGTVGGGITIYGGSNPVSGSGTIRCTINEADFGNNNEVEVSIRRTTGTGTDVASIQVSAL